MENQPVVVSQPDMAGAVYNFDEEEIQHDVVSENDDTDSETSASVTSDIDEAPTSP